MWEVIFDWPELVAKGADAVTYFILAAVGTILFLLRLGLSVFFGSDAGDFEMDGSPDVGSDASFTLFSLLSIMAFVMGTGWMGLACRIDWGMGRAPSALIAVGFGTVAMLFASGMMFLMRKANKEVQYDVATAVGKTARVYLTLPAKAKGIGQIEVSVSGRRKIMKAITNGKELQAFTDVRVVEARDDEVLIVEPLS